MSIGAALARADLGLAVGCRRPISSSGSPPFEVVERALLFLFAIANVIAVVVEQEDGGKTNTEPRPAKIRPGSWQPVLEKGTIHGL